MMTIVVDSFDGYSDLWQCFFTVFQKHWADCPYDIKLVSNFKRYDGVDTICTGEETCWSERTLKAVEQIDAEYILLLLEDYLLGEPIATEEIEEALEFMRQQNAQYLRLTNIPKSRFHKEEKIFPIYQDEEYGVNLQAAIWKKEYLIKALKQFQGSAWEFEVGFLKEAVGADHKIKENCFGVQNDPLHIHNGVLKGKWFPKEIKYFRKMGVDIAWEKRGKLSFWQTAKYNILVWLKEKLSYKARKRIKACLKRLGVNFVSDL